MSGLLDAGEAGSAEEMPRRVLDVVGVDRLVQLELFPPPLELTRVVEGDPALPVVSLAGRVQLDHLVEIGDGLLELPQPEIVLPPPLVGGHVAGIAFDRPGRIGHGRLQSLALGIIRRAARLPADAASGHEQETGQRAKVHTVALVLTNGGNAR